MIILSVMKWALYNAIKNKNILFYLKYILFSILPKQNTYYFLLKYNHFNSHFWRIILIQVFNLINIPEEFLIGIFPEWRENAWAMRENVQSHFLHYVPRVKAVTTPTCVSTPLLTILRFFYEVQKSNHKIINLLPLA